MSESEMLRGAKDSNTLFIHQLISFLDSTFSVIFGSNFPSHNFSPFIFGCFNLFWMFQKNSPKETARKLAVKLQITLPCVRNMIFSS